MNEIMAQQCRTIQGTIIHVVNRKKYSINFARFFVLPGPTYTYRKNEKYFLFTFDNAK